MLKEEGNSLGYGPMKKYSDKIILVLLFLVMLVLKAQAEEGVTIKVAAKEGGVR